jgi:hypothetical protein
VSPHVRKPGHAPSPIDIQADSHTDLWLELKRRYLAVRGSIAGTNGKAIPRTTNRDVLLLATRWTTELTKTRGDAASDRSERKRWRTSLAEVERLADDKQPDREYAANASFWDASNRLAIYLESLKMRPGRWQLAWEAISESVRELPSTISDASATTAAAARRFLSDPLKLGAVVLGAAIIMPALLSRR